MVDESRLSDLAEAVLDKVGEVFNGRQVLVALSGGADSAVLAWAAKQCGSVTRAVSVDHGLPGSSRLMEAAALIARSLEIDHSVRSVEPASSETALRHVRLAALEQEAAPGEVVATGHTLDDQAETVLGNVLRGAGTAGLAGIPVSRPGFVRPLLGFRREEIRSVADELGLPFADDATNKDLSIRRNRLRLETIPRLAAEYNPSLVGALGRLGAAAASDDRELETRAARVPLRKEVGSVSIPAAYLTTLPRAVAARVARRAVGEVRGFGVSSGDIDAILAAAVGRGSTLTGGVEAVREGPWVVLVAEATNPPSPVEFGLGSVVEFGDWEVGAEPGGLGLGRFSAVIPSTDRLVVRTHRPGEEIEIGEGSKRVSTALAEAGVPVRRRPGWPVVDVDGTIVWIAGVRAAPPGPGAPTIKVWARRKR